MCRVNRLHAIHDYHPELSYTPFQSPPPLLPCPMLPCLFLFEISRHICSFGCKMQASISVKAFLSSAWFQPIRNLHLGSVTLDGRLIRYAHTWADTCAPTHRQACNHVCAGIYHHTLMGSSAAVQRKYPAIDSVLTDDIPTLPYNP